MAAIPMSYVSGISSVPLIGQTIGAYFDRVVAANPDREALVAPAQAIRWTWRELGERVDAMAAGLVSLGLRPGERVGIWSPNNAEWVITQFATAKAGLILVNLNPAYRLSEVEYALNKVACRALVTATAFKTSDYAGMLMTLCPELASCIPGHLESPKISSLRLVIQIGARSIPGAIPFAEVADLATAASRAEVADLAPRLQFDDPINIQFTSGTTGAPKGATLTHHNILNNGFFTAETMKLTEHDRL